MKKIIVCVVVLLLTLLISCGEHKTDVTNYLAGKWNLPVDKDSLIYGDSSFGGFHGRCSFLMDFWHFHYSKDIYFFQLERSD